MISALVLTSGGPAAQTLSEDLAAVGVNAHEATECSNLLQGVIKKSPDIVVCFNDSPDASFFASLAAVANTVPRPVVVFTTDPDVGKMEAAVGSGAHAYVVAGYSRNRLRSVVQLAQARFRRDRMPIPELEDIRRQFDERKMVDRAKGILMGARQLREEEAFRALRSAAMASKQRIGQVSRVVIDSAHYAEAVNRAGQLRMLSQRIVKFYALACAGVTNTDMQGMFTDSIGHVDSNIAILDRSLSKATFGDLFAAATKSWGALKAALKEPPKLNRLMQVDGLAENLLRDAETLTGNLEVVAFAPVLHAINVVGRQRMLVQRLAKEFLMARLPGIAEPETGSRSPSTLSEFVGGLDYLDRLPLSNPEIARELEATHMAWQAFQIGLDEKATPAACTHIAASSEVLLGHFERLTETVERGIHILMGV